MKYLILFCLTAGLYSFANAQDIKQSEVPSVVLNAFKTRFSNATDVEWEKQSDLFKAEFDIGKNEHDLWLDKEGKVTKHKEEVAEADLPNAVAQKLKTDFKDYRVDDVDKVESNGKVYFEIDLDGDSGDREVLFLADGSLQERIE